MCLGLKWLLFSMEVMCIVDLSVPFYKNSVWPSIIKTILGLKDKGLDILAQCKKKVSNVDI